MGRVIVPEKQSWWAHNPSPAVSSLTPELPFLLYTYTVLLAENKDKSSSSLTALEANSLPPLKSFPSPSPQCCWGLPYAPIPACHISSPCSALANLSPNPVDSFYLRGFHTFCTSTLYLSTQTLSLQLVHTASLLLGLPVFCPALSLP